MILPCAADTGIDSVLDALTANIVILTLTLTFAQAGAWMRYDMSVGKIPSKDLQSWTGAGWKKSAIGEGAPHTLPPLQRPYHPPQPGPPGSLDLPASTAAAAHGSGSTTQSNGPTSNGRASAARSGAHSRAQTHTPSRDRGAPAARAGTPEAQVPGLKGKRNPLWVSPDVQQPSQASIEAGSPTDSGTAPAADSAAAEEPQEAASKGISTWTAQALLTAHYCVNSAFLLDNPILEVTFPSAAICHYGLLVLGTDHVNTAFLCIWHLWVQPALCLSQCAWHIRWLRNA